MRPLDPPTKRELRPVKPVADAGRHGPEQDWDLDEDPALRAAEGTFDAADPDLVPGLQDALAANGLGRLMAASAVSRSGRNENWLGITTLGVPVFVKLVGRQTKTPRAHREASFLRCAEQWGWFDAPGGGGPRRLAESPDGTILVLEGLLEADPANILMQRDEVLDERILRRLAAVLARLHAQGPDVPRAEGVELGAVEVIFESGLIGLTPQQYTGTSGGVVELYGLLQNDPDLPEAIRAAHAIGRDQSRAVPIHGDLRLDQVLCDDEAVVLIDWEEFRLGPVEVDLGALAGDVLYHALAKARIHSSAVRGEQETVALVVAATEEQFERASRLIGEFLDAYAADGGTFDPVTVVRRTGYQLVDRVLANAFFENTLSQRGRAALGIAKRLLAAPADHVDLLGSKSPS
jgi:phosphotransferase family enzyme